MVATHTSTTELIGLDGIREVLKHPGPCISVFLPPYRPGEQSGSPAALLNSYVHEAERELAERGVRQGAAGELLPALEHLTKDAEFAAGSRWSRAIFCSPAVFEQFHLVHPVEGALTVGGAFAIRKLGQEFTRPRAFHILALYKDRVALLRCAGLQAELVKLPPDIPETLAQALEFEPPDHDLENRAAIGSSTGAVRAVRFGTGSGRERERAHLADFYKLVDRGLQKFIREAPLILAGVGEDIALFRGASGYASLAKGAITGSPDVSPPAHDGLLEAAYAILRAGEIERQAAALNEALERRDPKRFSTDPDRILHAAFEGRVDRLYLNQDAVRMDVFERGKYHSWGKEDLLNLAAVQTIAHRGESYELPPEAMPDGSIAAGLMRF